MARVTEQPRPDGQRSGPLRAPMPADLSAGVWHVVPGAGHARFSVRDKLVAIVHGSLPLRSGRAVLGPGGALVEAVLELDVASVDTGNPRRDRDLAKPGLLDTAAHPRVVVTAGPAAAGPEGWELSATLSARGGSCPLALRARLLDGGSGGAVVGVTGRLDRRGLGMKVPTLVIGRYLDLDVELLLTEAPRP
ncbi:YceI family protein [Phycicoccus avicenniae]|uniref:YceI family protein n=1 Tax=Phycicoccus avicenniae TaxID=2828860 RepID=UPI003D2AF5C9